MRFLNYKIVLFAFLLLVTACGQSYDEQQRLSRAERYRLFREDFGTENRGNANIRLPSFVHHERPSML